MQSGLRSMLLSGFDPQDLQPHLLTLGSGFDPQNIDCGAITKGGLFPLKQNPRLTLLRLQLTSCFGLL